MATTELPPPDAALSEGEALAQSDNRGFRTRLNVAGHPLVADEPAAVGGTDQGPSPYGLISAALASCTAMTLHSYASRKGLAVSDIRVFVRHDKVHEADCVRCAESDRIDRLDCTVHIDGDIDEAMRERMMQIAARCPVHRTLDGSVRIVMHAG